MYDTLDKNYALRLTRGALLGAAYAALTIATAPISFGALQFRVAEAMTVLPWFYPEAVPGLFVGCLIANLFGGNGVLDIIFGSLATLAAALISRRMKTPWLVPLPPVAVNAVVIGGVLHFAQGLPFWLTAAEVGLGQMGACYGLGIPLLFFIKRKNDKGESISEKSENMSKKGQT
ncbi:MAG: QueT transporter family protein [Peptococcaceae bacterium]|nr:QueT transporter family protein [Peptococcaceae bacterium]